MTNRDALVKLWHNKKRCTKNCIEECKTCEKNILYEQLKEAIELLDLINESRKTFGENGVYIFYDDVNKFYELRRKLNDVLQSNTEAKL